MTHQGSVPRGGLIRWTGPSRTGNYSPARVDGDRLLHIEKFVGIFLSGFMSGHPCQGARTLVSNRASYYYAVYRDMSTVETALKLLDDIDVYYRLSDSGDSIIKSMVCIFTEYIESPEHFSDLFWSFVQLVHDVDSLTHGYDATVSSDPADATFELSFRGRAVFPTTLHPASRRTARRFAYPGWALNQSAQFNALRAQGIFKDWQRGIRKLDQKFDPSGVSNPLLVDHGQGSAAAQIGGVVMHRYPFLARTPAERPLVMNNLMVRAISEKAPETVIDRLRTLASRIDSSDAAMVGSSNAAD